MGVIELLTLAGVILRALGVIHAPWLLILLPEYITVVFYIDYILLRFWQFCRLRRRRKQN